MKRLIYLVILLVFAVISGCSDKTQSPVAPGEKTGQSQLEKAVVTEFTVYKDVPVALISPGELTTENGMTVMRDVVTKDLYQTSTPLVTGYAINTVNMISSEATQTAVVWGTFIITPESPEAGGGKWNCAYKGNTVKTGESEWKTYLHGKGLGEGGTIDGMIYDVDLVITSWDNPPTFWLGSGTGYLKAFAIP